MDNYEIQKCLYKVEGREVQLVTDKDTGEYRVIKTVILSNMSNKDKNETNKEVKALMKLQHRHIVSYVTSFQEDTRSLSIVMAYCQGGDLFEMIEKHRIEATYFPPADIVMMLRQLCEALAYVHSQHIIHRDIKPRNIFVVNRWTVQLGDFGIAKILESTSQNAETHNQGTYSYSAPEIFGTEPYRHKCDMWSLGCVLYELITLEQPFKATGNYQELVSKISSDPYPQVPEHVDRNLADLIGELLDKKQDERPNAKQILTRAFMQQPADQATSRAECLEMMSKLEQFNKKMDAMEASFAKKMDAMEASFAKKMDSMEASFAKKLIETKSEMFVFIEKEAQLLRNQIDHAPEPSEWSFDFYIENFEGLVKSDDSVQSMPVFVHIIKSSVVGLLEFNENGMMIVWVKSVRNPRQVGFVPTSGCNLKITATITDIHQKKLPDVVIGTKIVDWDETEVTTNVDFGFKIGKVKCMDLVHKGYGKKEGYYRRAILVRFEIKSVKS